MTVQIRRQHNVAMVVIDRPPVNGLDASTRQALAQAFDQLLADASVSALVLTGTEKVFCAGADIEEFALGIAGPVMTEPTLPTLINRIEQSNKPVVAAISGICMGGGLELALGCHYRLAAPNARFALPEVKLGILPGAGGTQRLPRAIGVAAALPLITSGDSINAERALQLKLVQAVHADVLDAAVQLAQQVSTQQKHPRLCDVAAAMPDGQSLDELMTQHLASFKRAQPAQTACVAAVRMSVEVPFAQALIREFDYFKQLVQSPESQALQYAFFSERGAAKITGVGKEVSPRPIQSMAVIGAGTMGGGIAMCAANVDIPVVLIDQSAEAVQRGIERIRGIYQGSVSKGRLSAEVMAQRMSLIQGATTLTAAGSADLIIEAVFEDLEVKQTLFRQLDGIAKAGAILASNTSTLDVDRIAAVTQRPQDVIGLHFFSPANVMRLLEIVRAKHTSAVVLASAMQFAKRIGKVGVIAGVCNGFIGNRMFEECLRQAYFLLDEGATAHQIDTALEQFGFAMGPLAVMDLAGQDIGYAIRQRRAVEQPDRPYSKAPDLLYQLGRYGQKTGAGYYRYDAKTRARQADAELDELIRQQAIAAGITQRPITDEEIVDRCVLALANEGALLLGEGFAQRASDIDVVWLNGYGFPATRGGPMFHVDQYGLARAIARMQEFQRGYRGEFWRVAPLLQSCLSTQQAVHQVNAPMGAN